MAKVPDAPYAKTKTPYFYPLAAGIQAMDSLAQVFSVPDFVWHQQGDGDVYVGSWADSFWGSKPPLQLPIELLNNYQGNRSATVAALPGLRPGATINQGERVTSVTRRYRDDPAMEEAVTRIVERRFPELTGNYHLPRFARVLAAADPPAESGLCDDFRSRYAVDLEVLGPDGETDPNLPNLLGVALPVPGGGEEAGFFGFPEEGTTVVMSFAYGLPNKPFILQILPHGLSLPSVPKGDQLWQHSEAVQQRADAEGNWTRQTDAKITDRASEREVEALDNQERYQSSSISISIDDHSTESVGGTKTIEALGTLKLLSGGSASLASVDDLHLASGRDLNRVVGQKQNAVVAGTCKSKSRACVKAWRRSGSVCWHPGPTWRLRQQTCCRYCVT